MLLTNNQSCSILFTLPCRHSGIVSKQKKVSIKWGKKVQQTHIRGAKHCPHAPFKKVTSCAINEETRKYVLMFNKTTDQRAEDTFIITDIKLSLFQLIYHF